MYDGREHPGVRAQFGGRASAAPLTLPGEGVQALLRGPFTFSGRLVRPADRTLLGGGTVYALFEMEEGEQPLWSMTDLTFQFEEAAPVPEPATLLLLGGGLAAVIRRARRPSIPS